MEIPMDIERCLFEFAGVFKLVKLTVPVFRSDYHVLNMIFDWQSDCEICADSELYAEILNNLRNKKQKKVRHT